MSEPTTSSQDPIQLTPEQNPYVYFRDNPDTKFVLLPDGSTLKRPNAATINKKIKDLEAEQAAATPPEEDPGSETDAQNAEEIKEEIGRQQEANASPEETTGTRWETAELAAGPSGDSVIATLLISSYLKHTPYPRTAGDQDFLINHVRSFVDKIKAAYP